MYSMFIISSASALYTSLKEHITIDKYQAQLHKDILTTTTIQNNINYFQHNTVNVLDSQN